MNTDTYLRRIAYRMIFMAAVIYIVGVLSGCATARGFDGQPHPPELSGSDIVQLIRWML